MTINLPAEMLRTDLTQKRRQIDQAREQIKTAREMLVTTERDVETWEREAQEMEAAIGTLERVHGVSVCLSCDRPTTEPGCYQDPYTDAMRHALTEREASVASQVAAEATPTPDWADTPEAEELADACHRFHPGVAFLPGQNHPAKAEE